MVKITFLGAGSSVFTKSIIGDAMLTPSLRDAHVALYDIDPVRLHESRQMLENLNHNINKGRARITAHCGIRQRKTALRRADYVVNAIQVGGYEPCTVFDFEIPKKYGLRQTIADTLGIGGIFRGLRTLHVMLDVAREMEAVCPDAWLLNYTNPMSIVTGGMLRGSAVRTVGLCHSVQGCASELLRRVDLADKYPDVRWKVAGINHMGWLLEIADASTGNDLYPRIKRIAATLNRKARRRGAEKHVDMVRLEIMRHFGYYVTESSEHSAEYSAYWIKDRFPELIEEFNIPLDEYPRRCVSQIEGWKKQAKDIVENGKLGHKKTKEYGTGIMNAIETDSPLQFGGNVLNNGLIPNLPANACVEVPCLAGRNGVQGCYVGALPEQLAGLNRSHINVHLLTIEAALTRRKDAIYQAAYLDPHTAGELTLDRIRAMCDELLEAERDWLPDYR
ncbi:MAG: alpha-glucosidase/alpha-galactosidase [Kiritimatiellia bacterium]|jgi:alpha-galactosidase|nr:alpha-glucosidase/alpha-galactosidase [Kiritimatiellia bacterium]MDP6848701.1 alpha-glucosidase/alpha-galactosidase [Kiritimatiellia bacterium]